MNLIVDIGNSLVKIAVFNNDICEELTSFKTDILDEIETLFERYKGKIKYSILSSVGEENSPLEENMKKKTNFIKLSHSTKIPIKNNYNSTSTLGYDRIAALVGANYLYPKKNLLVIDLGTAITYDLLVNNTFIGGNISPGIEIRYKSLHKFTEKLPLLATTEKYSLTGKNTNEAIVNGVQNGVLFEIQKYIEIYNQKNLELTTILTGGDSYYFEKKIKTYIFAISNLVLIGLNRIVSYNNVE